MNVITYNKMPGFFSDIKHKVEKLGNKVAEGAISGLQLGQKVTGAVSKFGHKYVDPVNKGIEAVSKIPFVGSMAQPLLGPARAAVGMVKSGLGVVDGANSAMAKAESGVRAKQSAVKAGDLHMAANVMRDTVKDSFASGKALRSSAKSILEKRK